MKRFAIIAFALASTAMLGACDAFDDDVATYTTRSTTYYNDGYYRTGYYPAYYTDPVVVRRTYY